MKKLLIRSLLISIITVTSVSSMVILKGDKSTIVTNEQLELLDDYDVVITTEDGIEDQGGGFNPAGYYNEKNQEIVIDTAWMDWAFLHEYGHFIDSINYNISTSKAFKDIYNKEKDSFKNENIEYSISSNIEYFASAYKVYLEEPSKLKEMCPETYNFIGGLTKK